MSYPEPDLYHCIVNHYFVFFEFHLSHRRMIYTNYKIPNVLFFRLCRSDGQSKETPVFLISAVSLKLPICPSVGFRRNCSDCSISK